MRGFQECCCRTRFRRKSIIFDFADVEYISSAGLRILLMARKKSVLGNMQIINVLENIYETFCVTGFVFMIDISKKAKKTVKRAEICSFKLLIEEKAKKEPDFEIISFDGQQYTWEELDKCAQILANDLYKKAFTKAPMWEFAERTQQIF